jgi:hypothetical protein
VTRGAGEGIRVVAFAPSPAWGSGWRGLIARQEKMGARLEAGSGDTTRCVHNPSLNKLWVENPYRFYIFTSINRTTT